MIRRHIALLAAVALVGCIAEASAKAPAATCDRGCLMSLADRYIAALVAHDPSKVPLADNVRMVENAKRIRPGEGLWKTTTAGPTDFKIIVPDPYSQEVGGMVMMQSDGKPAQVGFRLKLVNGKITEAEQMIAIPREASLANLQKPRPAILMDVPYEYRDSRGRLIHIAKSYYDALDNNNGALAPFAPGCDRHENGMRTAPFGGALGGAVPGAAHRPPGLEGMQTCASQINSGTFQYITTIGDRRVEVADVQTGLAIGFSHFHHAFTQHEFKIYDDPDRTEVKMDYKPFDLPAMHIFKIWGGQIHEIEAMGFTAPYNSPTGWECSGTDPALRRHRCAPAPTRHRCRTGAWMLRPSGVRRTRTPEAAAPLRWNSTCSPCCGARTGRCLPSAIRSQRRPWRRRGAVGLGFRRP
jgi:hypothetical protein